MKTDRQTEIAAAELILVLGSLIRRFRAAAPCEMHKLSWTQRSVLFRLEKCGPHTAAELARAEGVKSQSMATVILSLEKLGFLKRNPHPTDGRRVNIALSAKGKAMRANARKAKQTWIMQAMEKLTPKEQQTLLSAGSVIKKLLDL